ncbi:hypothetical protein AVEN_239051-1 [Araneus ventricosus]|uniref:Uncharacterized protein n=1 Tax=Araneus ventricosus TaxID=182803 RepID=A0A4Y2FZX6_ARAVE|nr:hypothetical protein AVEN_239051-1 [Araneus ventricosus]
MYIGKEFSLFRSKMRGGRGQATLDDMYRRHKLSYKIKIVEICLVVGAGEFLQSLPIDNEQMRSFFRFRSKMEKGRQTTFDDISRRHNFSNGRKCRNRSSSWGWRAV